MITNFWRTRLVAWMAALLVLIVWLAEMLPATPRREIQYVSGRLMTFADALGEQRPTQDRLLILKRDDGQIVKIFVPRLCPLTAKPEVGARVTVSCYPRAASLCATVVRMVAAPADDGFLAFYLRFTRAWGARDAKTLRGLIAPDVDYTFGRGVLGDRRTAAFTTWRYGQNWQHIDVIWAKGFALSEYGGYVAPPATAIGTFYHGPQSMPGAGYAGWRASFQQVNGQWRCTSLIAGD